MNREELTPGQRDMLVHTEIMKRTLEPCQDGQLDSYMGGYWGCTCGWVSDFFIGEGSTEHTIPVPRYTQSMDAAWLVLQKIASRYDEQAEYLDEVFYKFRKLLLNDSGDEIWTVTELLLDMAKWTPDHICRLALESVEANKK